MSQASGADDAEDQRTHDDEQLLPQKDVVGHIEEENINIEPLAEPPSGISNAGPSRPSGPPVHQSTSNVLPVNDSTPEAKKVVAEKDEPTLSDLANIMKEVLDVLKDSTIASKSGKDERSRFWRVYKRVAEEHDNEFLERYTSDMNIVLIFSGLFSAVGTSFIVAMESDFSPDPSDTTNALLKQLVQIGLGNLAEAGSAPVDPASGWSPTAPTLWIQTIAYASLSMSLLAAFGAVLGMQWLGYYKSKRYGRGSQEQQGKRRQEQFDGIVTWYFDGVVQSFPVLLQISLLLFGIALGAKLWYEQASIAWVLIGTTVFGFLFYSLTVMACLISPACPFQTPISTLLHVLRIDRILHPVFKRVSCYFQRATMLLHGVLKRFFRIVRSGWTRLSEASRDLVLAIVTCTQSLWQFITRLHNRLRSLVLRSSAKVVDSEAQPLGQDLDVLAENDDTLNLNLPDTLAGDLEAPSVKWLLETSTDPEVFLAAARLVPQVEWPLDLDVSDMLHQLVDIFTSCVDIQERIVPSLEEKASACATALTHLYYGRVLQAYPDCGEFIIREGQDVNVFYQIYRCMGTANQTVLDMTVNFCYPDSNGWFIGISEACPDSIYERLSHLLPYHFITGRVNENIENLAITVISKLLSSPSPSPPSNQILANCILLACVMVGAQVDKKDIVRIDKSSALPRLSASLLAPFQKALWASDGGELDNDSTGVARRAWKLLDIIYRILELAKGHFFPSHVMRNLDVCRKIYSRARSSGQNDASVSLAALRNALHFTFAAAAVSRDPAQVWDWSWWGNESHSPEDFDWMVDFDFIYSDDHETAYDILLLLGGMGVCCSPAKQHLFIERLIACMDSNMPLHLRHAALRAAHSAREQIASIDAIDDSVLRDIVLTKLSPAILSVLCPHPGITPASDNPHLFFDHFRDLCYLELVFALARNSEWHPHLFEDRHIDRCISMISWYCTSRYYGHGFFVAGILLQITPEQTSVTSLDSVTEQQWWDVMRSAWNNLPDNIYNARTFKLLLVLVDRTKKYMQIASKSDLEQLIQNVDVFLGTLEWLIQQKRELQEMGQEMQEFKQGEGTITAAKELRTAASNMVESFGQSLLVP